MNASVTVLPTTQANDLKVSTLTDLTEEGHCVLDCGATAAVGLSCLVRPRSGDAVLWLDSPAGRFVLSILDRHGHQPLTLGNARQDIHLQSGKLSLSSATDIRLGAARDCDITAAGGTLSLTAQTMHTRVFGEWVQMAKTSICQFGDWLANVRSLLKFHGERQQLTAVKEVKVDADIIHMG